MKKIEAVIRKAKFDEVIEALHEIEVNFFCYWVIMNFQRLIHLQYTLLKKNR